jgi:hypothetical protein
MSANYDGRGNMTAERRAEVAHELGLDTLPVPRYDNLPEVSDAAWAVEKFNFQKAIYCVDPLMSAKFMGQSFPPSIPIDQSIDPHVFKRGWSQSSWIDAAKPIPVNDKITAVTGITMYPNETNWFGWIALSLKWAFDESGARAMSPVLIYRTEGILKQVPGFRKRQRLGKLIGWIYTLDRTPKDGLRMEDMVKNVGILHPSSMHSENRVLPVAGSLLPSDVVPPNPRSDDKGVFDA